MVIDYEERLKALGLTTLGVRHKRGDIIHYDWRGGDWELSISRDEGRRHRYQIEWERTGNKPRWNEFFSRISTLLL